MTEQYAVEIAAKLKSNLEMHNQIGAMSVLEEADRWLTQRGYDYSAKKIFWNHVRQSFNATTLLQKASSSSLMALVRAIDAAIEARRT